MRKRLQKDDFGEARILTSQVIEECELYRRVLYGLLIHCRQETPHHVMARRIRKALLLPAPKGEMEPDELGAG